MERVVQPFARADVRAATESEATPRRAARRARASPPRSRRSPRPGRSYGAGRGAAVALASRPSVGCGGGGEQAGVGGAEASSSARAPPPRARALREPRSSPAPLVVGARAAGAGAPAPRPRRRAARRTEEAGVRRRRRKTESSRGDAAASEKVKQSRHTPADEQTGLARAPEVQVPRRRRSIDAPARRPQLGADSRDLGSARPAHRPHDSIGSWPGVRRLRWTRPCYCQHDSSCHVLHDGHDRGATRIAQPEPRADACQQVTRSRRRQRAAAGSNPPTWRRPSPRSSSKCSLSRRSSPPRDAVERQRPEQVPTAIPRSSARSATKPARQSRAGSLARSRLLRARSAAITAARVYRGHRARRANVTRYARLWRAAARRSVARTRAAQESVLAAPHQRASPSSRCRSALAAEREKSIAELEVCRTTTSRRARKWPSSRSAEKRWRPRCVKSIARVAELEVCRESAGGRARGGRRRARLVFRDALVAERAANAKADRAALLDELTRRAWRPCASTSKVISSDKLHPEWFEKQHGGEARCSTPAPTRTSHKTARRCHRGPERHDAVVRAVLDAGEATRTSDDPLAAQKGRGDAGGGGSAPAPRHRTPKTPAAGRRSRTRKHARRS